MSTQETSADERLESLKQTIDLVYSFAFIWSVGGAIASSCHAKFSKFASDKLPSKPPSDK